VQDYEVFANETKRDWPKPGFAQGPTHPAVDINWEDAKAFCAWLTDREQNAGKLGADEVYRLPSDHEWSCAVGIGALEDSAAPPNEKSKKITNLYPWGREWPPPPGAGNYAGEELQPALDAGKYRYIRDGVIRGYRDNFTETSPVGSFPPNQFGLYDMGGNVWQWCDENKDQVLRVRGASWSISNHPELLASFRRYSDLTPDYRSADIGFRCVAARESSR
jgi:formylglycine-generating enzyme required for sulfatase activity